MCRRLSLTLMIFLCLGFVHASCLSGQIDINSASLEELKSFTGIGDVKSQAIIDARPFDSVDDLIKVYGIGEVTLDKMINEGACVDSESSSKNSESISEKKDPRYEKAIDDIQEEFVPLEYSEEKPKSNESEVNREIIVLGSQEGNTKNIKTDDGVKNKRNYSVIGLILFSILITGMLLFKKRKYENEFREK